MRKLSILIFLIFSITTLSFGNVENNFSKIKGFHLLVKENTTINNKKVRIQYSLDGLLPNKLKKVVTSPELNKGEIYLYSDGSKITFYPLLNQSIKEKKDPTANRLLKFVKDLQLAEKNKKSDVKIIFKENKVEQLIYKDGITIAFSKYKKIDNIDFPFFVEIFDKEALVSTLDFLEVKINPKFKKDVFTLDEVN